MVAIIEIIFSTICFNTSSVITYNLTLYVRCVHCYIISYHVFVTVNTQQSNGSESDCNLVDSLLYDIRTGFPQKKGLEKDTKVTSKDILLLNNINL